ncbi:DNA polymerase III subunit gamma/tau [Nocardia brasiliensis]|uniref:DNA-directed DNA polymerase n=1 Tax=Nocardia brasiliensis (strain ATCC 700358 / HUJEG-1) TaxID=1133849 RepID=K0EGB2_NOCB7|nr:DNA polymerase III subunits gamma and tau [Nocardia brasiliensis ATCC 700358]OCF90899.1 DNA polymerase III subunit gamma/tau [Nocardia brasiliensis]
MGQEHVTDPLSTALDTGRISHAYLFSGPRGCGKTSSARILARSLNCAEGPTSTPCGTCPSCVALGPGGPGNLDVIELDAASHGGVDDTRELRDRAFYAPAESRYRVFIVDEAHMVTTAGFNALLKIVEEPPAHLIFIFATTEPDKVLPTIRSRTHHYPFRLLPPATMRGLLGKICDQEQVPVEEAVYPLVIRAGGGSPRDSLSVLDQLLAGAGPEGVTYSRAVSLLGVTDVALIDDAIGALTTDDGAALFGTVDRVVEAGHDPRRFAVDLLERLRDLILMRAVPDAVDRGLVSGPGDVLDRMRDQAERLGPATLTRYAELLHEALGEMRGATSPRLLLEVVCARMLLPSVSDAESATLQRLERLERGFAGGAVPPAPPAASAAPASGTPAPLPAPGSGPESNRRRGAEALAAIRREAAGKGAADTPRDGVAPDPSIGGTQGSSVDASTTTADAVRSQQVDGAAAGSGAHATAGVPETERPADRSSESAADQVPATPGGTAAENAESPVAQPVSPTEQGDGPRDAGAAGGFDDGAEGSAAAPSRDAASHGTHEGPGGAAEPHAPAAADGVVSGQAAPTTQGAPDAQPTSAPQGAPTAQSGPTTQGAPVARGASAAQGAQSGPTTQGAPVAQGGSAAQGAQSGPTTQGAPTAQSAAAAQVAPAAQGVSAAQSGPTAPPAAAAQEITGAQAAPNAQDAQSAAAAPTAPDVSAAPAAPAAQSAPAAQDGDLLREVESSWGDIRAKVREFGAAVQAMLAGASVARIEGDVIVFAHQHAPLAQRLSDPRNVEAVRSAVRAVLGRELDVRWEAGGAATRPAAAQRTTGQAKPQRASGQSAGREAGAAGGRGADAPAPPRFSRPSQAKNAAADKAANRPRSFGDDDIPPPDFPDLPDDPGPFDGAPPESAQPPTGSDTGSGNGWSADRAVPVDTPEDEEEMIRAAAVPVAPEDRRDPDEVALELLKSELGATRLSG